MARVATKRSVTSPTYLPAGTVVGRKYRIDGVLGAGGMGVVYRGWHLVLEQTIAIKVLRSEYCHNPEYIELFLEEARLMARLRGIHVGRVLDTGYLDGQAPFLVLEYLQGCDLRTLSDSNGPLRVREAVDYVLQTCEAIAEAHAMGIVHCDLKPDNLFLHQLPDGTSVLKVIDFGIARGGESTGPSVSPSWGQGSPQYMAPEQFLAPETVDARADIWSLGVLLFELLTTTVPFVADSMPRARYRIVCEPPASLAALRPDLPPELEQVVLRCLGKRPEDRFSSVEQLVEALVPFAPELGSESLRHVRRILSNTASNGDERACLDIEVDWEEVPDPVPHSLREVRSGLRPRAGAAAAGAAQNDGQWPSSGVSSTAWRGDLALLPALRRVPV